MTNYNIIGGDGRRYDPLREMIPKNGWLQGRLNGKSLVQDGGEAQRGHHSKAFQNSVMSLE